MTSEKQFSANRLSAQQQIGEVGAKVVILRSVDRKVYKTASARQLDANRQNAKKSTGPKTPGGRVRSSKNAVTHGLCSERWLLIDEGPEAFDTLWQAACDCYQPQGLELEVVRRVVSLHWRLRRAWRFETLLINAKTEDEKVCPKYPAPRREIDFSGLSADQLAIVGKRIAQNQIAQKSIDVAPNPRAIAGALESVLRDDLLNRLVRCERSLQLQLDMALKQLKEMQDARRKRQARLGPPKRLFP